jgi:PTH1 family peptidyl-tRNA hydrolase
MLKHRGRQYHLIKPTTFMNLSGKAVQYWLTKLDLAPDKLLVVVDDIALPTGKLRLRAKGSDGGHNGLKHIQDTLGTTKYARLRFGVGDNFHKGSQIDYVLGKWSDEEWKLISPKIELAGEIIVNFGFLGVQRTMSQYNNN